MRERVRISTPIAMTFGSFVVLFGWDGANEATASLQLT
jgi:hypothetical protein